MALRAGDMAPDFMVTTHDGQAIKLSELRGTKNVVLYFYPRDFTPVCTRETCGFRDMMGELAGRDTLVLGVSPDTNETHLEFAKQHNIAFSLISDPFFDLATKFDLFGGVKGSLAKLMRHMPRVTFVIDKTGRIAGAFSAEMSAHVHIDGVREAVTKLS